MHMAPSPNMQEKTKEKEPKSEVSKTFYAIKGALFGVGGGVVKTLRGFTALVGGTLLGSVMTGLGYEKKDVLKIINSPLESWWGKIKAKWALIPKTNEDTGTRIVNGIMKAIFIGIPVGLGSGLLALIENTLSAVWTVLVGGWSLGVQAANLSKKMGETIDNSAIFSGIARTNVFGNVMLLIAKIAKLWDPKYGEKIEEIRKQYPNAIDYVRAKIEGLVDGDNIQDNINQKKIPALNDVNQAKARHMIKTRNEDRYRAKLLERHRARYGYDVKDRNTRTDLSASKEHRKETFLPQQQKLNKEREHQTHKIDKAKTPLFPRRPTHPFTKNH